MEFKETYDVVIIGAGFFGLNIAEFFAKSGKSVLLCERSDMTMTRASYVNQARVHNGYHYPRSILTAMRSHESFFKFVDEFEEAIDKEFVKYYGIGKILSKVNSLQYQNFCNRVGDVLCEEANPKIQHLFNSHYIDKIFRVREFAFNATILNKMMLDRISNVGVQLATNTTVKRIRQNQNGKIVVSIKHNCDELSVIANNVFNCTYANINYLNFNSNIDLIPLKYEMTEMALVDVPDELAGNAFTIMCGPFFSIMPFPAENCYSLSHVRYTPHYEWYDDKDNYRNPLEICKLDKKETAYEYMVHDAQRYLPCMSKCNYKKSIWDVKTVLPSSEQDDSRPILFKMNYKLKGYHCIMGGKIDNIYDVIQTIKDNSVIFNE